ncbi:MAG: HEAT repeat domain-containing protein [Planctomycetota bacterium]
MKTLGIALGIFSTTLAAAALFWVIDEGSSASRARARLEGQLSELSQKMDILERELRSREVDAPEPDLPRLQPVMAEQPRPIVEAASEERAGEEAEPEESERSSRRRGRGRDLDEIVGEFASLEGEAKEDAVEELSDFARRGNEEALNLILQSLNDVNDQVREEAIEAISEMRNPELIGYLDQMTTDGSPRVREEVAQALRRMPDDQAGPILTRMLSDQNQGVVREALQALRSTEYWNAVPKILEYTRSNDPDLIVESARTLRRLGESEGVRSAVDHLAQGFTHPDPLERVNSIRNIRRIGGDHAIAYLESIIENDDNLIVRLEAQEALERMRRW